MERIFGFNENEPKARMKPFACIMLSLAVLVSSAYIGSRFSSILGMAALAASVIVMFSFAKSLLCLMLTALPAFLIWYYTGNIYLSALFCAAVTAIGTGAFLLKITRSPFLTALVPASYLLALVSGSSPLSALLSLSVFPAIAILSLSSNGKLGRLGVICRVSSAIFITGVAAALIYVTVSKGSLYPSSVLTTIDGVFDRMTAYYTAEYAALAPSYIEAGAVPPTEADAAIYALAVYGILPALVIIGINIISFVAHQLNISLLDACGQRKYLNRLSLSFNMSTSASLVFIVSYFVMIITSYSGDDTASLIAENIYLILLPGLVFTGILVLLGRREGGRRHLFWLLAIILLFFVSPNISLLIAAFIGCSVIISAALARLFSGREER